MAYTKTEWNNNTAPYINDTNLNKIEQGIYDNDQAITTLGNRVDNIANKTDSALGYDEYSSTSTYVVGDYCIYNNKLYVCNTAIATAEEFDSTKWTETSVDELISQNKEDIANINEVTDFSSQVTFNETPASYSMKAKNGVAYIEYNGATKAHALDTIIFTIPAGYRPAEDIFTPSIQSIKYARVWIRASDGTVRISSVSSTTDTSRINFTVSYLIGN